MPKLIDTNVMLAANAIYSDLSAWCEEASPIEIELREIVYGALREFDDSEDSVVLDDEGDILREYEQNMRFNTQMRTQEYGMLVLQQKIDLGRVAWVTIEFDDEGAVIDPELVALVSDRADRKWIASAKSHSILYEGFPPIMYGAESDWYVIQERMEQFGYRFERLLPVSWYQSRHQG